MKKSDYHKNYITNKNNVVFDKDKIWSDYLKKYVTKEEKIEIEDAFDHHKERFTYTRILYNNMVLRSIILF